MSEAAYETYKPRYTLGSISSTVPTLIHEAKMCLRLLSPVYS